MSLWRISNFASLDGVGGLLAPGRWHNAGRPILYAAETPAGALLEILAHLDLEDAPDDYQLIEIGGAEKASIETVEDASLPEHWRDDLAATRKIGDEWLASGRSFLLRVPSALAPHTSNYLINPRHPEAATMKITGTIRFPLDERLFRR
ncbi:RES family NAD+ phosphorylase [Methylocystis sp. 9N]|uniref:RES family NAD+ phosphorylase n=1 Tax=Methylocystis borbori TaxID=3118750 RepID=A0ABU7XHL0_9HYPH